MRVRVGFNIVVDSGTPTPTAAVVRPRPDVNRVIEERRTVTRDLDVHEYVDAFGNHVWRWTAPTGELRVTYDAIVDVSSQPDPQFPDLPGTPVESLPDSLLLYTLPSRYCPSDLVLTEAWSMFGSAPDGWARVQAVCDWVHGNITYGDHSVSSTSGYDAFRARGGVCRDFAHIAVMFCRALNIPARYACGYLPDIDVVPSPMPMDFHAWFEAYVGGEWRTFDARHNVPRVGRVLIARGRDAVDTAFLTCYGDCRLTGIWVWADQVDESITLDSPRPGAELVG